MTKSSRSRPGLPPAGPIQQPEPRLIVGVIDGTRSKAVVPAHLLGQTPAERFFADLFAPWLKEGQTISVRRVA